jgi:P4 family phage/plasmid primase-like protien
VLSGVLTDSTLSENELNNLDTQHDYINFRNCKVNLKTGDISKRTPDDFITEYIDFDYNEESDGDIRKKIKKTLKQICNNDKEDLEFVLSFLGYSITSETKEQKFLNLYGPLASNGKSTLIKMMNSVFGIYTTKTDRRTFNDSYTKSHKNFARMKKKRLVYVEEIEKGKVNTELLKDIVDGDKIENEILFSTTEEINIDFKLFIISNHMLRFNTDPGIARRLICMEFNSRFAEPDEYEKEKEEFKDRNVFVKDKDINLNIDKNDDYKNAFANLIIEYAMQFYEKGLTVPEKFEKVSKELCDENDKMKQFLNDNFDITKNDEDRVSKKEFHEMYINATGLKLSDWSGLLSDIKRLNLQYDSCKKRVVYNGKSEHGVILGIKKKQHSKEEDTNDIDFIDDDERSILSKSVVEAIKMENIELKMKLEAMQLEMDRLKDLLLNTKQPPASDILDKIKEQPHSGSWSLRDEQASVNHISTESEIDILDEINMNATVKPLHKSTAQDKNKNFKKLTKH